MARKQSLRTTFLCVVASVFFCASLYHHYLRDAISAFSSHAIISTVNYAGHQNLTDASTTAVLLPDWEVLVIVSPETILSNLSGYSCLFYTRERTEARFSGLLRFPNRATFTCLLPVRARRRLPFKRPVLLKNDPRKRELLPPPAPPLLLLWSYIVYDSLTTDENDVVLFVKGVNTRQGINRQPSEFRCVFGDEGVRTEVTTSMQEVFRCKRPEVTATGTPVKVSLEIVAENRVVPSVAYYTPLRKLDGNKRRPVVLCATTMVYDVTKFLREWIVYHSRIGVEKFLLYDNGSDDDLGRVVDGLRQQGFDINIYFWRWPKTQEAGFSHSVLYAQNVCNWMMYLDIDEFIYSPSWQNISKPSTSLLQSLLISTNSSSSNLLAGQISIGCHEFGPSDQTIHPAMGVTQGYNCRRRLENRHKSIVLLEAIDTSLLNFVHHFFLKTGYEAIKLNNTEMVVNHYKYQAWPEFKAKFRRRVSAYVLDWTQKFNPNSNDRTPGLGFSPVEPQGWPQKFCEVRDNRLKDLATKWFGIESDSGLRMAWQR